MRPLKGWTEGSPRTAEGPGGIRIAVVLSACAVMAGCSGPPTAPTATGAPNSQAIIGTTGTSDQSQLSAQAANLTPDDFAARGWECRPSPVPGRTVCSRPHQEFPAVPPPDDRPPSFTLLVWENGNFAGTLILIRPDLYQGQPCESSGAPYIFRPVIGYYECLHTVGPDQ